MNKKHRAPAANAQRKWLALLTGLAEASVRGAKALGWKRVSAGRPPKAKNDDNPPPAEDDNDDNPENGDDEGGDGDNTEAE